MANTKIVLNRQSDLILNNAQIVDPTGIVKGDLPGLVNDLADLNAADIAEASFRVAAVASIDTSIQDLNDYVDEVEMNLENADQSLEERFSG